MQKYARMSFITGWFVRTSEIQQRILDYLASRPEENAFLRSEFNGCGRTRSGVDKALRALVRQGVLVRGGYGVLVRGRYNRFTGTITPSTSADVFALEALRKLDVQFEMDGATQAYNRGDTTQIPSGLLSE